MAGAGGSSGAEAGGEALGAGSSAAATLPSLHRRHSCRDAPASLGHRLPVRVSPVPDLQPMLLSISRPLQAIPLLPPRLHGKHFLDLIMQ